MNTAKIIDCTLREGKQSLRRALSTKDILNISEKIISLGIDQLEVGHAAISGGEINMLKQIKKNFPETSLLTHSRAKSSDVQRAIEAGVDWVGIFISTNKYARFRINDFSIEKIFDRIYESVELAKANNLKVRFTVEDSSRTNMDLLMQVYEKAIKIGADRICLADTLGILEPKEIENTVHKITNRFKETPLEVHFHDDRGLSMANTLQAITSGAQWISSSVNGIGERSGITDTCLLLANLQYKNLRNVPQRMLLKEVSEFVSATTRLPVDAHRPVVGKKAFWHVADLHVKAMKKNTESYNWADPESFGHQTKYVQKLPAFETSDLIVKPIPSTENTNDSDINNERHVLLNNEIVPDINNYFSVRNIPPTDTAEVQFTSQPPHMADSFSIFTGKKENLEGLTCEIALDDDFFIVNSPVTVFIPAGVKYAFRVIEGEGVHFYNVANGYYNANSEVESPTKIFENPNLGNVAESA